MLISPAGCTAACLSLMVVPGVLAQAAPQPQRAPQLQRAAQPQRAIVITIDVAADRHPISPDIYGVSFGTTHVLADLGTPVNRAGGNSASLYNWQIDARNAGWDWFFESVPCTSSIFDQFGDGFVALSKAADARVMLTVPMIGWVARLGPERSRLAGFSVTNYGPQQVTDDSGLADAGNGIDSEGKPIEDNDPRDAAQPDGLAQEALWINHLVARWGSAAIGGVSLYALDNEPDQWHVTHRDVHPSGLHADELASETLAYAAMIKAADPSAYTVAPELSGWESMKMSGFDQQHAREQAAQSSSDRIRQTGGMDLLPWLLTRWKQAGHPVDRVSLHFYPQAGEYREQAGDDSTEMQLQRNRSTRLLWDMNYKDASWLPTGVALIPRLRGWVDRYYLPGTPIALTEYNWGGENTMNGATTEADLLGIFGRERLDLAMRWAAPAEGSPAYLAMKLFRNAGDSHTGFGDLSVRATTPQPDEISAFAAVRTQDHALTVIVINKQLETAAAVSLAFARFPQRGTVETARLAEGKLTALPGAPFRGTSLERVLPAQSVTLFVLHPDAR